tara:strand:+ start:1400 stop:2155 length:756 start_codon:yes stop_codon:yes gene_type:complete
VQIIPAIDLKNNKCVRLTEGVDESSVVFNEDPEKQALYFQQIGCKKIHIVDLDAAFGRPDLNISSIKKIRKSVTIPIQLGGGIRSKLYAEKYFDLGIENIIIGSMAVKHPEVVQLLSTIYKKRIYVSLDIKENNIMVKGWKEKSTFTIEQILKLYNNSEIRGYVITDIKNDGVLKGINLEFIKKMTNKIRSINNFKKEIIMAGGLTNYEDLKNLNKLKENNLEGVISGKSFYMGNIDLIKAQKILDVGYEN